MSQSTNVCVFHPTKPATDRCHGCYRPVCRSDLHPYEKKKKAWYSKQVYVEKIFLCPYCYVSYTREAERTLILGFGAVVAISIFVSGLYGLREQNLALGLVSIIALGTILLGLFTWKYQEARKVRQTAEIHLYQLERQLSSQNVDPAKVAELNSPTSSLAKHLLCPSCNKRLNPTDKFCDECGENTEELLFSLVGR